MDAGNDNCGCTKTVQAINKAIDWMDKISYDLMAPQSLLTFGPDGKRSEREIPSYMKAISNFEKKLVAAVMCPPDIVNLPELIINQKK